MAWCPSHNLQGLVILPCFLEFLSTAAEDVPPTWLPEVKGNGGWPSDHASSTLGMPGQSRRRWSPVHNRQGNLTFRGGLEGLSRGDISETVAALLASRLSDFFFFVFFFFFLATWLLESRLSPGEVEEEDAKTGEEGERSTLEST